MKAAIITVAITLLAAIAWSSWDMNARQVRAERLAAAAVVEAQEQAYKRSQEELQEAMASLCRTTRKTLTAPSARHLKLEQVTMMRQIEKDNCQ